MDTKPKLTPAKTTLDNAKDTYIRRDGNSTRQMDNAIQLLFAGETVKVLDHWENGSHIQANRNLFERILNRLILEHQLGFEKHILVDRNALIIKLK